MARNVLLAHPVPDPARVIARICGSPGEVGLVLTGIALRQEKVSGGRIEEERTYGGRPVSALDEPVFIGSAIAQLAGHCDAVVVDRLATWVERLLERFPDDPIERDAEIASLVSVLQARMADLVLVAGAPPESAAARALFERALAAVAENCEQRFAD